MTPGTLAFALFLFELTQVAAMILPWEGCELELAFALMPLNDKNRLIRHLFFANMWGVTAYSMIWLPA